MSHAANNVPRNRGIDDIDRAIVRYILTHFRQHQRPATLRQAVSRLGGACIHMLAALNENDPTQRRQARAKLFDAAMWAAWLVLMEDEEELCSTH